MGGNLRRQRSQQGEIERWRSRRGIAVLLRLLVLLAPVAVSVAASFAVTRLVPAPVGAAARIAWLGLVVLFCGLLAWPARRQLRRLLPLAALLELSILFPGEAPARWRVAREAGSIKHLELLADGVPSAEPARAATTILALVASLARHDRVTRGHSDRVRVFTDMISDELGLPRAERDRLRWAALIHDVGKLEVPAKLLRKPGKPTSSEWQSLRLHPAVGAQLTAPLADWLGDSAAVVIQHHERFDGTGYPAGLRGNEISLGARIVGLADAFEVMTAARPYKKASSRAVALREVARCSGTHFDPDVVRALLAVSTPRLRRALGPASWVGQLPVVGTAPVGGLPAMTATMARGAGTMMLGGVATAVVAGTVSPPPAPAPFGNHHSVELVSTAGGSLAGHGTAAQQQARSGGNAQGSLTSGTIDRSGTAAPASAANTVTSSGVIASAVPTSGPVGGPRAAEPASPAGGSKPGGGAGPGSPAAPSHSQADAPAAASPTPSAASPSASPAGPAQTVGQGVGQLVGGVGDTVSGVTSGVGGTVGGPVGGTLSGVGSTAGGVVSGVGSTVGTTLDNTVTGLLGGSSDGSTGSSDSTSGTDTSGSGSDTSGSGSDTSGTGSGSTSGSGSGNGGLLGGVLGLLGGLLGR
ncbi:MAG: HD-GYP domain-containing protein [Acidothermaceae bacterium]